MPEAGSFAIRVALAVSNPTAEPWASPFGESMKAPRGQAAKPPAVAAAIFPHAPGTKPETGQVY